MTHGYRESQQHHPPRPPTASGCLGSHSPHIAVPGHRITSSQRQFRVLLNEPVHEVPLTRPALVAHTPEVLFVLDLPQSIAATVLLTGFAALAAFALIRGYRDAPAPDPALTEDATTTDWTGVLHEPLFQPGATEDQYEPSDDWIGAIIAPVAFLRSSADPNATQEDSVYVPRVSDMNDLPHAS